MFGRRPDGRVIKNLDPIQKIMPYIMKTRNDAMNLYEEKLDCAGMDSYIKAKKTEGVKLTYMHIMIAAMVRMLALRPQLNRFIMNGKIYARPKIWVSFAVHPSLREGDAETTIKLCFEGTENLQQIAKEIDEAIERETVTNVGESNTDKVMQVLMNHLPGPLIKIVINTLMWMDRHNMMPKFFVELSPFHTSFWMTNLKSLGIGPVYHHLYNFGTTGLFMAIGKEKQLPVFEDDAVVSQKQLPFTLVADERFCDGLYFARALRQFRKFIKNPVLLEGVLEAREEDVK